MLQPVKTALERLYCFQHGNEDEPSSSIPSQFSDQLRSNDISIAKSGMRCKDWFVTCHHPNKEFVFCGQDSMFVKEQGACRSTRPTDKCPVSFLIDIVNRVFETKQNIGTQRFIRVCMLQVIFNCRLARY